MVAKRTCLRCSVAFWRATNRKIRPRIEIVISDNQIAPRRSNGDVLLQWKQLSHSQEAELEIRRENKIKKDGIEVARKR